MEKLNIVVDKKMENKKENLIFQLTASDKIIKIRHKKSVYKQKKSKFKKATATEQKSLKKLPKSTAAITKQAAKTVFIQLTQHSET